jgi:hypothetical protein
MDVNIFENHIANGKRSTGLMILVQGDAANGEALSTLLSNMPMITRNLFSGP